MLGMRVSIFTIICASYLAYMPIYADNNFQTSPGQTSSTQLYSLNGNQVSQLTSDPIIAVEGQPLGNLANWNSNQKTAPVDLNIFANSTPQLDNSFCYLDKNKIKHCKCPTDSHHSDSSQKPASKGNNNDPLSSGNNNDPLSSGDNNDPQAFCYEDPGNSMIGLAGAGGGGSGGSTGRGFDPGFIGGIFGVGGGGGGIGGGSSGGGNTSTTPILSISTPEPSTYAILGFLLTLVISIRRYARDLKDERL
jgi:hypothetical protein